MSLSVQFPTCGTTEVLQIVDAAPLNAGPAGSGCGFTRQAQTRPTGRSWAGCATTSRLIFRPVSDPALRVEALDEQWRFAPFRRECVGVVSCLPAAPAAGASSSSARPHSRRPRAGAGCCGAAGRCCRTGVVRVDREARLAWVLVSRCESR
jgi:hypothetical protein